MTRPCGVHEVVLLLWHPAVACAWTKLDRVSKGCLRERGSVTRFSHNTFRDVAQQLPSHKGILTTSRAAKFGNKTHTVEVDGQADAAE